MVGSGRMIDRLMDLIKRTSSDLERLDVITERIEKLEEENVEISENMNRVARRLLAIEKEKNKNEA